MQKNIYHKLSVNKFFDAKKRELKTNLILIQKIQVNNFLNILIPNLAHHMNNRKIILIKLGNISQRFIFRSKQKKIKSQLNLIELNSENN